MGGKGYLVLVLVLVGAACVSVLAMQRRSKRAMAEVAADFTTAPGAVLMLEAAFRNQDIEAAVQAKSFAMEAELMLRKLGQADVDDKTKKMLADTLELSFRDSIRKEGFPDFQGVVSTFPDVRPYQDELDVVVVNERCQFPDGGYSKQKLLVGRTENGWRVLNPVD